MMDKIIKLTKEDIVTAPFGKNIAIEVPDENFTIIFDPGAAIEFSKDVMVLIPDAFDDYWRRPTGQGD